MNPDYKLVYRFLGYGVSVPEEPVLSLIHQIICEMQELITCQAVYSIFPIMNKEKNELYFSFGKICSKDLYNHLTDCEFTIWLAATVGSRIDRYIQKYSRVDSTHAVIAQAVGAMFIETYCDILNEQLRTDFLKDGIALRPRFSPGYGDFDISYQTMIFNNLDCKRLTGMSLMDSKIMSPSKSVTAIIGAYPASLAPILDNHVCGKCERCPNTTCEYRLE